MAKAGPPTPIGFDNLLVIAKNTFSIQPADFWKLTFGEWWPMYNQAMGKVVKPLSHLELESLEERWINGNS